jgi:hypothetical protein
MALRSTRQRNGDEAARAVMCDEVRISVPWAEDALSVMLESVSGELLVLGGLFLPPNLMPPNSMAVSGAGCDIAGGGNDESGQLRGQRERAIAGTRFGRPLR